VAIIGYVILHGELRGRILSRLRGKVGLMQRDVPWSVIEGIKLWTVSLERDELPYYNKAHI